jgi:putative sterol carrier protein
MKKGGWNCMVNELTKANINLYAEVKNLVKNQNMSIQFSVKNGPEGFLRFDGGKCTFTKGKEKCTIKLYFKSPEHFNNMIDGKANPIVLKGLTKVNFLKNEFIKMTDKLSYYLKPNDILLKDDSYFNINTILTFYTVFFSLAEIGNTDKIGKLSASRIPNGVIGVSVLDGGPSVLLEVKNGRLEAKKGATKTPRASMIFKDISTVNAMFNGKIDSYSCIAAGKLMINGYIPMIDNMNKLLAQVPDYLQ